MNGQPMRRRSFITLLGVAAAAWPLAAGAQQAAMPVIGILSGVSFDPSGGYAERVIALRQGLRETGFVEGQNLAIEYRSADGQFDRLPALAADLVRRRVAVIVGIGTVEPALVAKAATSTIPIVFAFGGDPVDIGLVASLNRPGANVTGTTRNNIALDPKRLEFLSELVPHAKSIAFLASISNPNRTRETSLEAAARAIGRQLVVLDVHSEQDVEAAFATMVQQRIAAAMVSTDAVLNGRRHQITRLAALHGIPVIYSNREFALAGGLISYGPTLYDHFRVAGTYVARILKGEKPADLPAQLPTKFEMVINLKAARALGLTIPMTLQVAAATEVIE
jgi:putative ABC transport system substrate-binding protein